MSATMSVVIPAHDEASIIADRLRLLVESDVRGELEIVVVANGCTDRTADVAAAVSPRIRVVSIPEASKTVALNAGDRAALAFPRAYVDADVAVAAPALLAVARRLTERPGAGIGAPRMVVDARGASAAVRAYYRIWEHSEYRVGGHVGSGVYVLSAAGRARFDEFPDVIADDRFAQLRFAPEERITVDDEVFTVFAPRTLRALVRRGVRIATGNLELADRFPSASDDPGSRRFGALLRRVASRPALWPSFAVYCWGYAVPRIEARVLRAAGQAPGWRRDETIRV